MQGKEYVCPNCEQPWTAGGRFCRYCGSPFTTLKLVPKRMARIYGPPSARDNRPAGNCPNCMEPWTEGDKYCRSCGSPLEHIDSSPYNRPIVYGPKPPEW